MTSPQTQALYNSDILNHITAHLIGQSDLSSLALTCHSVHDEAMRKLYRHIKTHIVPGPLAGKRIRMLCCILHSETLASYVRKLSAGPIEIGISACFPGTFQRLVSRVVPRLPLVEDVNLDLTVYDDKVAYVPQETNHNLGLPWKISPSLKQLSVHDMGACSLSQLLQSSDLFSKLTSLSLPDVVRIPEPEDFEFPELQMGCLVDLHINTLSILDRITAPLLRSLILEICTVPGPSEVLNFFDYIIWLLTPIQTIVDLDVRVKDRETIEHGLLSYIPFEDAYLAEVRTSIHIN